MNPRRIVSLLPSATEIVCALGLENRLVGRSHVCDFPSAIQHLPVCTAPQIDASAASRELNRAVKDRLRNALSLYEIDVEKLQQLQPDLILTQTQCDVCAVSLAEVEQAVGPWLGVRPQIISLSPQSLADVWEDFRRVAEALGVAEQGKALVKGLKFRAVDVIEKTCMVKRRPSVACIEWIEPLMAAGNWVPELVDLAGGRNLFGQPGKHSPWLEWAALVTENPEVIVVMPCGFDLKRTRQEMAALTSQPGWGKLRAVKRQQVFLADGSQFFNRPGPRLVESLEILAELLHPESLSAKHVGSGWEKL